MHVSNRVATNLENLQYSGISLNIENSGNSVQLQENNKQGSFSSSFQYLVRVVSVISVLKIIINNTVNLFLQNCNQHFANFKPKQFTSAVWYNCLRIFYVKIFSFGNGKPGQLYRHTLIPYYYRCSVLGTPGSLKVLWSTWILLLKSQGFKSPWKWMWSLTVLESRGIWLLVDCRKFWSDSRRLFIWTFRHATVNSCNIVVLCLEYCFQSKLTILAACGLAVCWSVCQNVRSYPRKVLEKSSR